MCYNTCSHFIGIDIWLWKFINIIYAHTSIERKRGGKTNQFSMLFSSTRSLKIHFSVMGRAKSENMSNMKWAYIVNSKYRANWLAFARCRSQSQLIAAVRLSVCVSGVSTRQTNMLAKKLIGKCDIWIGLK